MFLYNDQSPVAFADELPKSTDIVVIGGGIIGISTAWYLRERGLSVVVCDKGRVNGEQSSRNWGWVRVTGRDPDEVPVAIDSLRCWEALASELGDELGLERHGILALTDNEKELEGFQSWLSIAEEYEMDTRVFSRNEVNNYIDVPAGKWVGGIVTPSDCRAEPFTAVPAIARGLQARGGIVRENCAVRTVESEAGKITQVVTEHGTIRTQAVVCAAGSWTSMFLSNLGVRLPQLSLRGTVARLPEAPSIYEGAAGLEDVFIRRRNDGGYTVAVPMAEHTVGPDSFRFLFKYIPSMGAGSDMHIRPGIDVTQQSFPKKRWSGDDTTAFEETRVLNPGPSQKALKKMRKGLQKHAPQLGDVPFAETWGGLIDATPDVVPVMDEVATQPGLFIATGFSGHGFGIGPGAGKVIADMVTGEKARFDLSRFRFSRFSDGSKMRPGPAI